MNALTPISHARSAVWVLLLGLLLLQSLAVAQSSDVLSTADVAEPMDDPAIRRLYNYARYRHSPQSVEAAAMLIDMNMPGMFEICLDRFNDKTNPHRIAFLEQLGRLKDPRLIPVLAQCLEQPNHELIQQAVIISGELGPQARPLVGRITRLVREKVKIYSHVRYKYVPMCGMSEPLPFDHEIHTLGQIGGVEAQKCLINILLTDQHIYGLPKVFVSDTLSQLPDPDIDVYLNLPDEHRKNFSSFIENIQEQSKVVKYDFDTLCEIAQNPEKSYDSRYQAIIRLGRLGDKRAITILHRFLDPKNDPELMPKKRYGQDYVNVVILVLSWIRDQASIDALARFVLEHEKSDSDVLAAIRVIRKIGGKKSFAALRRLKDHPSDKVLYTIANYLFQDPKIEDVELLVDRYVRQPLWIQEHADVLIRMLPHGRDRLVAWLDQLPDSRLTRVIYVLGYNQPLVPEFRKYIHHRNPWVRQLAQSILYQQYDPAVSVLDILAMDDVPLHHDSQTVEELKAVIEGENVLLANLALRRWFNSDSEAAWQFVRDMLLAYQPGRNAVNPLAALDDGYPLWVRDALLEILFDPDEQKVFNQHAGPLILEHFEQHGDFSQPIIKRVRQMIDAKEQLDDKTLAYAYDYLFVEASDASIDLIIKHVATFDPIAEYCWLHNRDNRFAKMTKP